MISHLLKLIWNQRKGNALIIIELFLIFILLWVCNYLLYIYLTRLSEPMGYDIKHVYRVEINDLPTTHSSFEKDRNKMEDLYTLVDRIKTCPEVEEVSVSAYSMPFMSYSNWNRYVSEKGFSQPRTGEISTEYIDVFRIQSHNPSINLKEELINKGMVMTIDTWNDLFPEETNDYTFRAESQEENTLQTNGIVTSFKRTAYQEPFPYLYQYLSRSEVIKRGWFSNIPEVAIRVYPEADKDFPNRFKEFMKGRSISGNSYIVEAKSMESFKRRYYSRFSEEDTFKQTLFILGFFMVNILLGVVGTFWIRTEARKGEMGLRVALGSPRNQLKGIMIGEALLLLAIIWIPAVLVCLHLGYIDIIGSLFDLEFIWSTAFISIAITTAMMALMIILGVIYPAYESTAIEPAEALHYE